MGKPIGWFSSFIDNSPCARFLDKFTCMDRLFPGKWTSRPGKLWVFVNTLIYFIISAAICFGCVWIPATDTSKLIH